MKIKSFILLIGLNLMLLSLYSQENRNVEGIWLSSDEGENILMDIKAQGVMDFLNLDDRNNIQTIKVNWEKTKDTLAISLNDKIQKLIIEKIDSQLLLFNGKRTIKLIKLQSQNSINPAPIFLNKIFNINNETGLFSINFKNKDLVEVKLKTEMSEVLSLEVPWKKFNYNNQTLLLISDFALFSIEKQKNKSIEMFVYRMTSNPKIVQTKISLKETQTPYTLTRKLDRDYGGFSAKIKKNIKRLDSLYLIDMQNASANLQRKMYITNHLKKMDSLLNLTFNKTLAKYRFIYDNFSNEDYLLPTGKTEYIEAQKAWIAFKEKEVAYTCNSYESLQGGNASGNYEFCKNVVLSMTRNRLKQLLMHYDRVELN